MDLATKVKIKLRSMKELYFFQKWGYPQVKNEKISKSAIKKYLPSNPVSIDCGAYDGSDSVELYRVLGGTVYAFEPVDSVYKRLKRNTAKYPAIHCCQVALSNKNGKEHFYVSEGRSDASSSLLEPLEHLKDHPDTYFSQKIEVEAQTLDDWASSRNISKIDLLWLDMQGFEMNMLKASERILKTVSVIHSEVSTKETYKGVAQYREYRAFLESKGFKVAIEAIPPGWDMGNVLFVKA